MLKGKLTCSYKLTGTDTFRLAAAKLLGHYGTNLQNPTESLMRCVVPDDDCVFIQPDQQGAEALVVAMEARPGKFRRLFELKIKVHSYMALQLFLDKFRGNHPIARYQNVAPDTLITYPELKALLTTIKNATNEYDLGKRTIHAKNYKMGPRTFQLFVATLSQGAVNLAFKQAKEFLGTHEVIFPEIVEWQELTIKKCKKDRILRNLFGYPREFTHLWNDAVERQVCAFIPQSTIGVITHLAYTELHHRIASERLPWKLLNNKHDSLLLQVPDNDEHKAMAISYCKAHMGRELTSSRGETYRMGVGISVGHNWGHYDEKENPEGLKELND